MPKKKLFVLAALGLSAYLDAVWSAVAAWSSLVGLTPAQWAVLPTGQELQLLALFAVNAAFKIGGVASIGLLVGAYLNHRPLEPRLRRVATFWAVATVGFLIVDLSGLGGHLTAALVALAS